MSTPVSADIDTLLASRHADLEACCAEAGVPMRDDPEAALHIDRTLLASDFAFDVWQRQPQLLTGQGLARLGDADDAASRCGHLRLPADEAGAMCCLRRFRDAEALRLVYRDVNGMDRLEDTLAATSVLYETLLEAALQWSELALEPRYGRPRDAQGDVQRLVVIGFGKLGGSELNFSSDIDLVLAFAESGQTDGRKSLDNSEYFARLGRQLIRLLAEHTHDGIVARVDMRLRPFGKAGRLALPFAAMEQYYQREGRDWERYAWIKARPVAGDLEAGAQLLEMLRPFVYRKYLDYTAFAGLREMKTLIDAEVARKDLSENLKLGPGGIREIEFIVQLMQLIRAGREPSLRVRGLLPALSACEARGHIGGDSAARLRQAYCSLRHVENRVQMFRDAQTHDEPGEAATRTRVALALGYADWAQLLAHLDTQRKVVTEEFATVMVPQAGRDATAPEPDAQLWTAAEEGELTVASLTQAGFAPADAVADALTSMQQTAAVRAMSARGRARLHRLMPQLIAAARETRAPGTCLIRLTRLVQAVARRSAYLALLEEQPTARRRLADLFAERAFLAESVIAHPLLLDDVLDPRIDQLPMRRRDISMELRRSLAVLDERDPERELERLNEMQASIAFRLGLAFNDERAGAAATARRLATLASAVLGALIVLAKRELQARHGALPGEGSGFAVLGYGSLGGEQLGFASDLDLVFVYDGERATLRSDGARPLDGLHWYQRLAQRVMHWIAVLTRAGRLYEVDTRLRPDGSKGLLVTSLDAFTAYQRSRAWTWEHQALLRARPVAGDVALGKQLEAVRRTVLMQPRDASQIRVEVSAMRRRWRATRDRSNATLLDLKQGRGALLDIEFLLQGLVLSHASAHPDILAVTANDALIDTCAQAGLLDDAQADTLRRAHDLLLAQSLDCTLDRRSRVVPRTAELERLCAEVDAVVGALDYDFGCTAPAG